jgi:hypothetical protein
VQLLQDPHIRNRSREVLAEEIEERAERACHGEDIRHILLLLPGQKEILRLIRAPQIRHRRIVRSSEDGLSDVGQHEPLQQEPHARNTVLVRLPARFEEQDEAEKWTKQKGNARLRLKFEQYLLENEVKDFKRGNLLAYGIRDWSKDPYGAACHAWRPGRKSWEVIERLKAFSIGKRGLPNVHICGEAYSDYQGFIEGALRSAAIVLNVLGAKIPGV